MKTNFCIIRRVFIANVILSLPFTSSAETNNLRQSFVSTTDLIRATLSILSSRRAYAIRYGKLLLGQFNLELWDVEKRIIYFSAPRKINDINKTAIEFLSESSIPRLAILKGNRLEIDGRSIIQTDDKYFLFGIDQNHFRVDAEKKLEIDFGRYIYRFTPLDIATSVRNLYIHGGQIRVRRIPEGVRRPNFLNHGAMVSQYGEPSLLRLVEDIVSGLKSKESMIQSLLDFVTHNIQYDSSEFYFGREFLQRSAETLLAGKADCSNTSILFASMLEQLRIEYVLAYTKDHIYVAVPKEKFENENDLEFLFNNQRWTPAETTIRGFKLGKTRVAQQEKITRVEYIQYPSKKNTLYDISSQTAIMFN